MGEPLGSHHLICRCLGPGEVTALGAVLCMAGYLAASGVSPPDASSKAEVGRPRMTPNLAECPRGEAKMPLSENRWSASLCVCGKVTQPS